MTDQENRAKLKDWWLKWYEADYSWEGLKKQLWIGHKIDGRQATLQDYWRDQEDDLLTAPNGIKFTRVHFPMVAEDGITPTEKADWPYADRQKLYDILKTKLADFGETKFDNMGRIKGQDNHTQLQGGVFLEFNIQRFDLPSQPDIKPEQIPVSCVCFQSFFGGDANFSEVAFLGGAYFSQAMFLGQANFNQAAILGRAFFARASFLGEALFDYAVVESEADFSQAAFSGGASFSQAAFGEANFSRAAFSGNAYFMEAAFSGVATFRRGLFSGDTFFENVQTKSVIDFEDARFKGRAVLPKQKRQTSKEAAFQTDRLEYEEPDPQINFSGATSSIQHKLARKAWGDAAPFFLSWVVAAYCAWSLEGGSQVLFIVCFLALTLVTFHRFDQAGAKACGGVDRIDEIVSDFRENRKEAEKQYNTELAIKMHAAELKMIRLKPGNSILDKVIGKPIEKLLSLMYELLAEYGMSIFKPAGFIFLSILLVASTLTLWSNEVKSVGLLTNAVQYSI